MPSYNDTLDAEQQVDTEEMIASLIFDAEEKSVWGVEEHHLSEEECAQLGRDILLRVLAEFRPDLVS